MDLDAHEVVRWKHPNVGVWLSCGDGTSITCRSEVVLTNKHIRVVPRGQRTYTVANKGDRSFKGTKIPIAQARPHRFIQPWFGPYKWETHVSGRLDLEPQGALWTLNLTFYEGSAFEYRAAFLDIYGAATQAAQIGMEEALPAYSA